jgi:hypothetical protein
MLGCWSDFGLPALGRRERRRWGSRCGGGDAETGWSAPVEEPGLGDLFGLRAARKTVKGFDEKTDRPRFYNVWLDK